MTITTFEQLGLSEVALKAVASKGFTIPTPIQQQIIPIVLDTEKDVFGQAQTGSGKTASFGLPLLDKIDTSLFATQALILAPTRELAIQVAEEIISFKGEKKVFVTTIYGGAPYDKQIKDLRKGSQIVVGTPGRVKDHMNKGTLNCDNIKFFVLDEADEMLKMGFQEEVEEILESIPETKRMLLFSATMPKPILDIARRFMKNYELVNVESKHSIKPDIEQVYFLIKDNQRFSAMYRIIESYEDFYGMIFCRTRAETDEVCNKLNHMGIKADAIHGDHSQPLREKVLAKFKSKSINVLVCTDVAARGIDVNDLSHVINYNLPQDNESYVHRIGRTGRAGKKGIAVTLITKGDRNRIAELERKTEQTINQGTLPDGTIVAQKKFKKIINDLNAENLPLEPALLSYADEILFASVTPQYAIAYLLQKLTGKSLLPESYELIDNPRYDANIEKGGRDSINGGDKRRRKTLKEGKKRLFVAMGKRDGMSPRKLVQMIEEETKVPGKFIDDVSILDEFSFMTCSLNDSKRIVEHYTKKSKGKRPLVEFAAG